MGLAPPWLNLLLGILILSDTIVNGIAFFISFSDSSLSVYTNVTVFLGMDFVPCCRTQVSFAVTGHQAWGRGVLGLRCAANSLGRRPDYCQLGSS